MMILGFAKIVFATFIIMGSIFYLLERFLPLVDEGQRWTFRKTSFTKLLFLAVVIIVYSIFSGLRFSLAKSFNSILGFDGFILSATVAQLLCFFIFQDFLHYCSHRFVSHGFLWDLHKVHHCDTEVDWMSTFLVHPLEFFQSILVTGIAFAIFPVSESHHGYIAFVNTLFFGPLPHANVWLPVGKWGQNIFVTPQSHHIHHRNEFVAQHSNYSKAFSFWDRIFKTHQDPSRRSDGDTYGIPDKNFSHSFGALLWYPFGSLFRKTMVRIRR